MLKNNFRIKFFSLFLISTFTLSSCLENPSDTVVTVNNIPKSSKLVSMFEPTLYFSFLAGGPGFIKIDTLYKYLDSLKIFDIRSESEFADGHIHNSINISTDSLLNYFLTQSDFSQSYVIICKTGERSAYFSFLLSSLGFYIRSLPFGIASWNQKFANDYFQERLAIASENDFTLTNDYYPKGQFNSLPDIEFADGNYWEILEERVKDVWNDDAFVSSLIGSEYTVCYGNENLYLAHQLEGPMPGKGHPINSIMYKGYNGYLVYDLLSKTFLQTLPNNKKIYIYSYSGIYSAVTVAYLRILGYDCYSLKYGAGQFIYDRLIWSDYTKEYMLLEENIRDYPFETGQ